MITGLLVHSAPLLATGNEPQKAGPIGLAVILVLCIACYFLFKSMSKHLRKVREEFPRDDALRRGDGRGAAGPVNRPTNSSTERAIDQPTGAAPASPPDES